MTNGHNPGVQHSDITGLIVAGGNAAKAKAEHREEALRRFLQRPLAERLAEAIALLHQPARDPRK